MAVELQQYKASAGVKDIAALNKENKKTATLSAKDILLAIKNIQDASTAGEKQRAQSKLVETLNFLKEKGLLTIDQYNKSIVNFDGTEIDLTSAKITAVNNKFEIKQAETGSNKKITDKPTAETVPDEKIHLSKSSNKKVSAKELKAKYEIFKATYDTFLKGGSGINFELAYQDYCQAKINYLNSPNAKDISGLEKAEEKLFSTEYADKVIGKSLMTDYQKAKLDYLQGLQKEITTTTNKLNKTTDKYLKTMYQQQLVSLNNLMRMHSSLLVNKKNIVVLADIYAEEGNKAALKGAEYLYKGDRKQAYKYFAIGAEKYLQAAEQIPGKKVGDTTAIERSLACKKQQNQIEAQLYAGLNEQLGVVNSLKKLKENYLFKDTNKFTDSIKEQEKILTKMENEARDILGVKELNKKEQRGRKIREGVSASDDRSFYEWQTTAYEVKNNYKYEERVLKILSRTEQDQFIARKKIYEASGNVDGLIRVSQFISNGSYSADQKIDARLSLATIALAEKNFTALQKNL